MHTAYWKYLFSEENSLFTVVCLPCEGGKFPTVITRTPYDDDSEFLTEDQVCHNILQNREKWLQAGFAVVHQHCRGTGKSGGDCIPYIHEREDGLHLQDWIRKQDFYNGELYLVGGSYGASVHFVTAPFAPDIKGAVLEVQDCMRYNCNYRNGFYKIGLHGSWYVQNMYKKKSKRSKPYTTESFNMLPLSNFSKTVFGETAEDFDEILRHPDKNDPFWLTRYGGSETRDALKNISIPVLLVTGAYDIYTGGVLDMWEQMDERVKKHCALVVHPYGHGGTPKGEPIEFPNACVKDLCPDARIKWLLAAGNGTAFPFETGKITYYRLFENRWHMENSLQGEKYLDFYLGTGERTYKYDPNDPARFQGGLCTNFGGCEFQDPPGLRQDILNFYTPAFEKDTFVKGKMQAKLCVRSSCEDTCFYMRVSVTKPGGDYGLRDDIQSIFNFVPNYVPGEEAVIDFTFDPHFFLVKKGERLRIDISSSAMPFYVRHTNQRGLFSVQTETKIAENTVILEKSFLRIFHE